MVTIRNIDAFDKTHSTVMTIGTFDGVHIGHRKILDRLATIAKQQSLRATLLTFFPHPRMVLQKDSDIKLLNTIEEKQKILFEIGLDYLIVQPFTKDFSRLSAVEFVRDILVGSLQMKTVIIGYDHRFGRNRNANIADLRNFGSTFDFEVEEIPAQEIDDVSVSSTKIRKALGNGDIETANGFLGYHYMLNGTIAKGKGLGRQLGFPTANLHIPEAYKLIPKKGAYVIQSTIDGKPVQGMMNIGTNPTVGGTEQSVEVHYFNLERDLYGQKVQVDILYHLRDEQKFDSVEALKGQLAKDREKSIQLLSK